MVLLVRGERYQEKYTREQVRGEYEPRKIVSEKRKGEEGEDREEPPHQPKRKKMRQMKIGETREDSPRYSEFGEEQRWEIFDWEGKMEKYKRELEEEEKARKER